MSVVGFLIYLVVMVIICGLIYYVVTLLPLPEPFKQIAVILVLIIFILLLLGALFGAVPLPRFN